VSTLALQHRETGGTRASLDRVDWVLAACVLTLTTVGALLIFSATRGDLAALGSDPAAFLRRHVLNAATGAGLAGAVALVGWRSIRSSAALWWIGSVLGLLAVLSPLGVTVNGSRSWIALPAGFSLQPAELAKVALVLLLAVVLGSPRPGTTDALVAADARPGGPEVRQVITALGAIAIPAALVLAQPDVGTVTVIGALGGALLVVAGVRARWLVALALAAVAVIIAAIRLGLLRDYQLARFAVFANPGVDPLGVGYNTEQARIAIESGGLTGTGLFAGPRTRGSFVPEQPTDFIFTVAGEELGFVGGALIIVVFGLLLWRVLRIGARSPDLEGRLVAAGVAGWFGFQAFQNIGMTLGVVPVTGLPLPFVSYGGSSMFAGMLAIGLLQGVAMRTPRTFT
jgi:rod shape determining protein RodA